MLSSKSFATLLVGWSIDHSRDLPWKTDRNPYKIWLSEIILQQTRVQQGLPYYLHFVETYPDVFALASASVQQITKSWEGLGYYTRARNLHKTAKIIVNEYNGVFPNKYDQLLKLPGIGPYSAAAIASFAFEEATPVVDGNVLRFIARLTALKLPIDTKEGRTQVYSYVHEAIQGVQPSIFNQAIMDFGATICKPIAPLCIQCPFAKHCKTLNVNKIPDIPIKKLKTPKQERYITFIDFIINDQYSIICHQNKKDIWKGLYLLPEVKITKINIEKAVRDLIIELFNIETSFTVNKMMQKPLKQVLTHRVVYAEIYQAIIMDKPKTIKESFNLVERSKIRNFAMPKLLTEYFKLISI